MKHAQFEIMGLAVAIIIITFAGIFAITVMDTESQETTIIQSGQAQFSQSLLDAWLRTTHPNTNCPATIGQYFAWKAANHNVGVCTSDTTLNQAVDALGDIILTYTGLPYRLEVRREVCESEPCNVLVSKETCNQEEAGRAGYQQVTKFPHQTGKAEFLLWVCE